MKKQTLELPCYEKNEAYPGYGNHRLLSTHTIKEGYLGLEIEMASSLPHDEVMKAIDGSGYIYNNISLGYYVGVSSDSSIIIKEDGRRFKVELTFAPAPLSVLIERVRIVAGLFAGKARAYNRGGIHVTYCGQKLNQTAARVAYFISSFDDSSPFYMELFNRRPTTYCDKEMSIRQNHIASLLGFNSEARGVEIVHRGTKAAVMYKEYGIELRGFNSNLDFNRINEHLLAASSIVDFAKQAKTLSSLSEDGYVSFLLASPKKYSKIIKNS